MKRIKQIIEALRVLGRTPSKSILDAWAKIHTNIDYDALTPQIDECVPLINGIVNAVVTIAKDSEKADEDSATKQADGEVAK